MAMVNVLVVTAKATDKNKTVTNFLELVTVFYNFIYITIPPFTPRI